MAALRTIILLIVAVSFSITTAAQNSTITGSILDDQTGEPLPGVQIIVSPTQAITVTDKQGILSIFVHQ